MEKRKHNHSRRKQAHRFSNEGFAAVFWWEEAKKNSTVKQARAWAGRGCKR
jgi:hypothetical protein